MLVPGIYFGDLNGQPLPRLRWTVFLSVLYFLGVLLVEQPAVEAYSYPWSFTGRLWFRPALVQVPDAANNKPSPPQSVSILSLFGWTLGGVVALEYDDSPVGPYREYVTMGGLVTKRGAVGQWGSTLYVSNNEAERICQEIWRVPAQVADIEFVEGNEDSEESLSYPPERLCVTVAPDVTNKSVMEQESAEESNVSNPLDFILEAFKGVTASQTSPKREQIVVEGWKNTRTLKASESSTRGPTIPIFWTPTIKALWAPVVLLSPSEDEAVNESLPLHRLRLSASAFRLHLCGQEPTPDLGIPLGIGLSVDNILIEIGPEFEKL